jgi:hypothetical protein
MGPGVAKSPPPGTLGRAGDRPAWTGQLTHSLADELGEERRHPGLNVAVGTGQLAGDGFGNRVLIVAPVPVGPDQGGHGAQALGLGTGAVGQGEMPFDRSEGGIEPGRG